MTASQLLARHAKELVPEVGSLTVATDLLSRRLEATTGPAQVLDLVVRLEILIRYLQNGDTIQSAQIDKLVEMQVDRILLAHRNAIKKELGLT